MAKYKIKYQCGCTDVVQLYGTEASRAERAGILRNGLCRRCQSVKAAEISKQVGLLPLLGTEKQIAWAETIRQDAYSNYERLRNSCAPTLIPATQIELLFKELDAHWWIQNRSHFKSFNSFILFINTYLVA